MSSFHDNLYPSPGGTASHTTDSRGKMLNEPEMQSKIGTKVSNFLLQCLLAELKICA